MSHTPPPWKAQRPAWRRDGPPYKSGITAGDKGTVANVIDHSYLQTEHLVHRPRLEPCPDAYLIAAAPSLLAACEDVLELICDALGEWVAVEEAYLPPWTRPLKAASEVLELVIAKAKGDATP